MNGSDASELGLVPPPGNGPALERWSEVRLKLRQARKSVLEELNLNEDSLKRLEEEAFLEFADTHEEEIETENGLVTFVYHPMFIHKNSQVYGGTNRLHWREKQTTGGRYGKHQ